MSCAHELVRRRWVALAKPPGVARETRAGLSYSRRAVWSRIVLDGGYPALTGLGDHTGNGRLSTCSGRSTSSQADTCCESRRSGNIRRYSTDRP